MNKFMNEKLERWIPYLLALVVIVTSMRGGDYEGFKFLDAPRHALNGAFIYDLVRTGNFAHPVAYGKQFYSHFPAISIPYHPPLFPAIEALFYSAFGVNMFAARLSVALAAGVSALLCYHIVNRTHRSVNLAIVSTAIFMTMSISQLCASDVMTEFTSLALSMGALYCLRDLMTDYPPSRAYPFALLAGAAVWTKQHTVFLGLVPFLFIILQGNWSLLRRLHLWLSSFLLGLMVLSLLLLSVPVKNVGVTKQFVEARDLWAGSVYNAQYYVSVLRWYLGSEVTWWLLLSAGAVLVIPRLRRRPESRLYIAWILALLPLLLLTSKHDIRYLFFGLPALVVLACDSVRLACYRILPERYVTIVTGILSVFLILNQAFFSIDDEVKGKLHVPLARIIKEKVSKRVLYCGENAACLAIRMRILDPDSNTIIIRGEKLDPALFTVEGIEQFAWRYGVDTIVIEPGVKSHPWDFLAVSPTKNMIREQVIADPITNDHQILVFRFANVSSHPESSLDVPISFTNGSLNLSL